MSLFYYLENRNDIKLFIEDLVNKYPEYVLEPSRLHEIITYFRAKKITIIVDSDYVEKQYRDTYYTYFSQKFSNYLRNCLRLACFESHINPNGFKTLKTQNLEQKLIGTIALRPLKTGNIGRTILNPQKLRFHGYLQTCLFKVMVYGRKLKLRAFPFFSQDAETMTCAETALYNLVQYYSEKYSEYREIPPNEILNVVEESFYERVLPSNGLDDKYIAKVLLESNLYPKLYAEYENLDELLYTYIESGSPLILGLPQHVVVCIGHGRINKDLMKTNYIEKETYTVIDNTTYYYINTADLVKSFIIMDDNKKPYTVESIDDLTFRYVQQSDLLGVGKECRVKLKFDENNQKIVSYEDRKEKTERSYLLSEIKYKYNSLIVPLYKRVYIDAARAKEIFMECFLEDEVFLAYLRDAYHDNDWGITPENPLIWRMFLTSSNKYKDFKSKTSSPDYTYNICVNSPYPRFIWVLEIGTMESYSSNLARAEIVLDATSSRYSDTWGILSVRYKEHFIFLPRITDVTSSKPIKNWKTIKEEEGKNSLTKYMPMLYTKKYKYISEDFTMFSNSNLKEV